MSNNIHPCFWYNGNAKAAAEFYCTVFPDSKITVDSAMVVNFELYGQKFMGLNGGPQFTFNPSVSFMVTCEHDAEIDELWNKLSDGGFVMMPLNKYDWSERYGFLQDKFGLSWQIYKGNYSYVNQKITPTFLFIGDNYGRAEASVKFYTKVFSSASIDSILLYTKEEGPQAGKVKHAQYILDGKVFMAMDGFGPHQFAFNEAISFVIECKDQQEIDYYWDTLIADGGRESMCGWLKDKFGVSWQVIPNVIGKLMSDPAKGQSVMQAILQMKKLDIAKMEQAFNAE
ncbi:MAG: VOC family protein [Chitinophagaceae bacterium]|nr:VOC family protein [Chitinophagaceae bacterium]